MHYQEMFQHFFQPIYQLFAARYSILPHFLQKNDKKMLFWENKPMYVDSLA